MTKTRRLAGKIGFVLCAALLGALTGSPTYGQPSVSVGVSVSVPSVQIRAVSDFYEPLAPQGEWVVIGSYGRCWRPRHVAADWRPYCNGHWQRTDDGWYWVSDEPWAWATYHYGRWNFTDQYGWYWVPQTQWAPAWVSWHEGGGYIGWAPLYPSGVRVISPRAYVFVEERHFMDPVRSSTAIAYNTTIINKTVINEAPAPAAIEKASGRKFQAVPVREMRQKEEAPVVARQRTPAATAVKNVQPPVRTEAQPNERKAVAAPVPTQTQKPAPVTTESRPEGNHGPAVKEPAGQNANQQPVKQEKSIQPPNTKAQQAPKQPAKEKAAASGNNGANPAGKGHNDKSKD
ncbi:MAG TPA: DUF6600 domain-containing protein [Verrucomicrobiae bacterium]|nr:DUF6600 domain-containing protein [Verrucomicrobiae bacterium]